MSLTVNDLSPDQRDAYNAIVGWMGDPTGHEVLTLGGYAGCLSGNTRLMYGREEDWRRWLYTACTRAAKKLTVLR
jgi:hypothetical protein